MIWSLMQIFLGTAILLLSTVGTYIAYGRFDKEIQTRPSLSNNKLADFSGRFNDSTAAARIFVLVGLVGVLIGSSLFLIGLTNLSW